MAVTSKLFTSDSKLNVSMKLAALTRSYSPSNTLIISQTASETKGQTESSSQTLTISQSATSQNTFSRSISQPLIISQSVSPGLVANRSLEKDLTVSQTVVIFMATGKLGITDSKSGFTERLGGVVDDSEAPSVASSLSINQIVQVLLSNPRASNTLTLSQTIVRVATLSLSISNNLSLIQVVDESKFKPRSVSQSLTITQDAEYIKSTGSHSSLTISQSVAYQYAPHLELSTQTLTIAQTLADVLIRPRTVSQSLSITQTLIPTKIITRSASQSLAIIQNVNGAANTALTTSLVPSQVVVVAVLRNNSIPTQSLHITQSVSAQLILNRTVTSNLILLNYHEVPNGQGGFIAIPNLLYAKGGPSDNACCPISGGTTYFQAPSRAIILPNPEFGDGEANVGAVKIIRTITGGTFSYVKKSVNRKLKYKFHITQRKAFELRQFLLDFLATRLMMTNWKGEMWTGYFLSDPAEITSIMRGEACIGDLYEVELDFQGIKVN